MSAYATTKKILTSLHGRLVGLSHDKKLVVFGKTALTQDDQGVVMQLQAGTVAINTSATLTIANILTKIITSTSAAVVNATLPTGTLTDAGFAGDNALGVNESFDWVVINTGPNPFTLVAGAGHTIVGNPTIGPLSSGQFRTRKTATNTFVTYNVAVGEQPIVAQVNALDATGALTAALIAAGIVTSTTAAAVVATVDTGANMDTALAGRIAINEGVAWSAINTGPNAFTVTAAAGHTLVGAGAVAAGTSGRFLSKRTAVDTWITYRLS